MNKATETDLEMRKRFGAWLGATLSAYGVRIKPLAEEYARGGRATQESAPRHRVREWRDGERTISAASAFKVGSALAEIGPKPKTKGVGPYASGPVALFASGHFSELVELLGRLAMEPDGAWPALALYCGLPTWMNDAPFEGYAILEDGSDCWDYQGIEDARNLCMFAVEDAGVSLQNAFDNCNGGRGCEPLVKRAITCAEPEEGISIDLAQGTSWFLLGPWALDLYCGLGGNRSDAPRFEMLSLRALHKGQGTIEELVGIDLGQITALRPGKGGGTG